MNAILLENGNLLIPKVAEGEGIIGDGMIEIGKDHPEYAEWLATVEE